jgi:peptidoglycan biosynthesis protein MviN/MurJ (putative lipid II flippase)
MTRQVFSLNGAGGIALAVSLSSVFQLGILYALWNKRSRNYGSREVYSFYLNMLLISALLGIGLEWFKDLLQGWLAVQHFRATWRLQYFSAPFRQLFFSE